MIAYAFALAVFFGVADPDPAEYASFDIVCETDQECLDLYRGVPCWGDEENLLDDNACKED